VAGRTDYERGRWEWDVTADFCRIVVGLPRGVADLIDKIKTDAWGAFTAPAMILLVALMT